MNHDVRLWVVPLLAVVCGLILFVNSKDRWATIGGYIFVCGFFILLWLLTVGGLPIR